jgi:hypothetical protein
MVIIKKSKQTTHPFTAMKPNATTAIAPHAPASLDDTHCQRYSSGGWMPAPRKAYAILHVTSPCWFAGDLVGCDKEVHPVCVPAGKTISDVAIFDRNASIVATPCTRDEYMDSLAAQQEEQNRIEQDRQDWGNWLDSPEGFDWF